MEGIRVISKGNYSHSQPKNIVSVKQYLFVSDANKEKFILLNLSNDRKEVLTRLKLCITQFDGNGEEISSVLSDSGDLSVKSLSRFSFNQKIELNAECVDFRVKVVDATYGNYSYSDVGSEVVVTYRKTATPISKSTISVPDDVKHKGKTINERFFMRAIIPALVAIVTICLAFSATIFQVNAFKESQVDFVLNGVEYKFVDEENKSEGALVEVVGYNGSEQNIVIDKEFDGYIISSIQENAFYGNKNIKTLTINGDVEILADAFGYCTNLYSVKMPEVKKIGYSAFECCTALKSFESSSANEIGEWAFYSCSALESITLANENDVLRLGRYAFFDCESLKVIDINQYVQFPAGGVPFKNCNQVESLSLKNYNFTNSDLGITADGQTKISALFGDDSLNPKLKTLKTIEIDFVDKITFEFCLNQSIESITIGNLVSSEIEDSAFRGCNQLNTINLPLDVTVIGDEAFSGTSISAFSLDSVTSMGDGVFKDCKNLRKISIPDNFTTVSQNSFSGCTKLDSVIFGETTKVTTIAESAFQDCSALKKIKFPKAVTAIGDNAFSGCSSLKTISTPTELLSLGNYAFQNCSAVTNITLSSKVQKLGNNCFDGCLSVKSLVVPKSVTSMGDSVFSNMGGLQALTVPYIGKNPKDEKTFSFLFGVENQPTNFKKLTVTDTDTIKEAMFKDASTIQSISFLNNIKSIGNNAFFNCKSLQTFEMPEGVTSIGYDVFKGCENLVSIDFSAVSEINSGMFSGCKKLKEITFSPELTIIGKEAFKDCESLESFDFSEFDKLSSILDCAFENCTAVTKISISASTHIIGSAIFRNCTSLQEITMPFVDAYENGDAGIFTEASAIPYYFGPDVVNETETPTTGNTDAIDEPINEPALVEDVHITIPASLKKVVFINAGATNKTIEKKVFENLSQVEEIVISEGITTIVNDAMSGLKKLTKLTLPSTLTTIGSSAFVDCYRLYEIFNYSDVEIVAGAGSYGDIGYNALLVHSKTELESEEPVKELLRTETYDGFEYACVGKGEPNEKWFMIDYPHAETVSIPLIFYYYENEADTEGEVISYFSLANCLFCENETIKTLNLSMSVEGLGKFLAKNATNLRIVTFDNCFYINEIPTYAFSGCSSLEEISLPDCVETIRAYAFDKCTTISYFALGAGVKVIEDYAFTENKKLFNVINNSGYITLTTRATTYGGITAYARNVTNQGEIQVPPVTVENEGLIFQKGSDSQWYLTGYNGEAESLSISVPYNNNNEFIYNYIIDIEAFKDNSTLKNITFDGGLSGMCENAITNCSALESLTFNKCNLQTMTANSFVNCESLSKVVFTNCSLLTQIENYVFNNCQNIKEIVLCEGLETINDYAFNASNDIEVLQIPTTLSSISTRAFGNLNNYNQVRVYCRSSQEQANQSVIASFSYLFRYGCNIYYYADCVHNENQWNFDINGNRSNRISATESVEAKKPDCHNEGILNEYCKECGELIKSYSTPVLSHSFDANGKCTFCGWYRVKVTTDNFSTIFKNDANNPFLFNAGVITSYFQVSPSISTLSLTAECDLDLTFKYNYIQNYFASEDTCYYTVGSSATQYLDYASGLYKTINIKKGETFSLVITNYSNRNTISLSNIEIVQSKQIVYDVLK